MQTIQVFRLAAVVAVSYAQGRHRTAKRALWALLGAIKLAEVAAVQRRAVLLNAGEIRSEAYERGLALAAEANSESGAISLPLAVAQAAIALGLASGVASLMAWAQSLLGGVL